MTGPCPFGFGPGSITPYTYAGSVQQQQQNKTYDFPATDFRSNSYAHQNQQPAVPQAELWSACPKHIVWEKHKEICANTTLYSTIAGNVGGAYATGMAAAPFCAGAGAAAPVCIAAAAAAGAYIGSELGHYGAQGHSSCQFIIDGSGQCVDSSHHH